MNKRALLFNYRISALSNYKQIVENLLIELYRAVKFNKSNILIN